MPGRFAVPASALTLVGSLGAWLIGGMLYRPRPQEQPSRMEEWTMSGLQRLPRWTGILAAGVALCAASFALSGADPRPRGRRAGAGGSGGAGRRACGRRSSASEGPGRARPRRPQDAGGPQADDPAYANYDFSKRIRCALTPAEELRKFVLQPGYRLELVLSDPDIQEPTAIAFDGNGRMFVLEDSRLHAGCRRDRRNRSGRTHLDARGHQQRRRLRQAHGVRRPPGLPALPACRSGRTRCSRRNRTRRNCGSTPTRTATASPTSGSCSTPDTDGSATSSTRRAS